MLKSYLFVAFFGIFSLFTLIFSFQTIGSPFYQQELNKDNNKSDQLSAINRYVSIFATNHRQLPKSLLELKNDYPNINNQNANQTIEYKIISENSYELCADFTTDTLVSNKNSSGLTYGMTETTDFRRHPKGPKCFSLSIQLPMSTPISAPPNYYLLNGNFENWSNSLPDKWTLDLGSQLNKSSLVHTGNNASEFVENRPNSVLFSDPISASSSGNYTINLWYQTESKCVNCGFVAFQFTNTQNQSVVNNVNGCGEFNPILQSWVYYLPGDATGYKEYHNSCLIPKDTKTFVVKIGVWSVSDKRWRFDDIDVKPNP